jgi:hypothetical protein
MWWWRKGLDLVVLLVHMVLLVGVEWFIMELSLVVLLGMLGVFNNSLVVEWLISGHPVFGGHGFRAVPGGVHGVFIVNKAVEPSRLWGSAFASTSGVGVATLLCEIIRDNLRTTQSRQKSYANTRRRQLEFEEGDHVYLKVSPIRGTRRFKVKGKLSRRFIGLFKILKRVGEET